MNDYLVSEPSFDRVVLEQLRFRTQQHVSDYVAQSLQMRHWQDKFIEGMIYAVEGYVLSQRLPAVEEKATRTFSVSVPATWFQHLKLSMYRFRWLRRVKRRWPARMEQVSKTCTLTVNLERYRTFPKADIALPEDRFGRPVYVAVPRKDFKWLP